MSYIVYILVIAALFGLLSLATYYEGNNLRNIKIFGKNYDSSDVAAFSLAVVLFLISLSFTAMSTQLFTPNAWGMLFEDRLMLMVQLTVVSIAVVIVSFYLVSWLKEQKAPRSAGCIASIVACLLYALSLIFWVFKNTAVPQGAVYIAVASSYFSFYYLYIAVDKIKMERSLVEA